MENIRIIKKMYEHFAMKDMTAIRELFDASIQWNQMKGFPGGGQHSGADAVFTYVFDILEKNWLGWKAEIIRYTDTGDSVFVTGFYQGIYKATGKYMTSDFVCEYKLTKGKITEFNQYTDTFLIAQAMGLTKD